MSPATSSWTRSQFSLRALLAFAVAAAAYCAAIMVAVGVLTHEQRDEPAMMAITVLAAWCILWGFYRVMRMSHGLIVHYSGPIAFGGFGAILGLLDLSIPNSLLGAGACALFGMWISSVVSLPAAILLWLLRLMPPPVPSPAPGLCAHVTKPPDAGPAKS